MSIFSVEDDDSVRELVVYALNGAGMNARGFADASAFLSALNDTLPDLILLDVMLPGTDGVSLLTRLRAEKRTANIPVVMLTAKDAELDRVRGLDLGADDYITKPFSVMELTARVKAVLRRVAPSVDANHSELSVGGLTLSLDKHSVTANGLAVTLTFKEFELLHYLMLNEGIVLSRDTILSQIWGYDYAGESRTIDMHVKSIRQKLGDCGDLIKTIRSVGYTLRTASP